jgi:glucose uptake protein
MILPTTSLAALELLVLSMICWGSWANAHKLTGKWRFELFYYDYSLGVVICSFAAAFTLGSMNARELTFTDNLLIASNHQMAYAVAGGAVFNLANILLVAAISVSGMALAFPVTIGLALVISIVWNYALSPQGNAMLLFGGALLVLVAVIVDAFAYSGYVDARLAAAKAGLQADPRAKATPKPLGAARGIVLSLLSGIFMSFSYPLMDMAKGGENAVSAYGMAVLTGGGMLLTTFLYVPFFANFPVSGEPLPVHRYFRGTGKQHLWGIFGGMIWVAGAIASFAAANAPASAQAGSAVSYALGQGAPLVSALWGLLVWREFKGADFRTWMLLVAMIVLFGAGVAMVSIAPLYSTK